MKNIKAVYLNASYTPTNVPADAACITYDKVNGLLFHKNQNGDILNLSEVEATVKKLAKDVKILKTDKVGGKVTDENDNITTTVLSANISGDNDISIIQSPELSAPVVKAVTVDGKNISIEGTVINATIKENENSPTLTIKSTGTVSVKEMEMTGEFKPSTNQLNIPDANVIEITNSTLGAAGYNGIMIGQSSTKELPEVILIKNVDFSGVLSNNVINIYATKSNALVVIDNCKFGVCSNPIRFANTTNATGVKVLVRNCHFEAWDSTPEWSGVMILEDFASESEVKKEYPILASDKAYGKLSGNVWNIRILPQVVDREYEANRFGKNKLIFEFVQCTYDQNKMPLVISSDKYPMCFGSNDNNQIVYVSKHSNYASIFNDETGKYQPYPYSKDIEYMPVFNNMNAILSANLSGDLSAFLSSTLSGYEVTEDGAYAVKITADVLPNEEYYPTISFK
jgi:hypothetical protein